MYDDSEAVFGALGRFIGWCIKWGFVMLLMGVMLKYIGCIG